MTRSSGADPRVVGVISGILVVLIGLVIIGLVTASDEETGLASEEATQPDPVTATPGTPAPSAPEPTVAAATPAPPEATGAPGGAPAPEEPAAGGPREPTDADAAEFTAAVASPGTTPRSVLADLDADGRREVVVATLLGGRARIDVGTWGGTTYAVSFSGEGASAEALQEVRVADINGDGHPAEVVLRSSSGTQGESISVWGAGPDGVRPLRAVGGCWDGSNVYGIVGASLGSQRITATCDGSPAPIEAWPSDIYVWDPEQMTFVFERTLA